MKTVFAVVLALFVAAFAAADPIPLTVGLKYRQIVEETKYVDGQITEKVIKDYGYSELNQQMLDLLKSKLRKKNYVVNDNAAYAVLINPVVVLSAAATPYSVLLEVRRNSELMDEKLISGVMGYASDYPDTASTKILEYIFSVVKG